MYRNKKLLEVARLIPCQHCGIEDGTCVAAHSNQQFGGILLGKLVAANMNSTADQIITMFSNPSKFILRRIVDLS